MWHPRRAGLREVLSCLRQGEVTVRGAAVAVAKARRQVVAVRALEPVGAGADAVPRRHRLDPCCRRTAGLRQR